MTPIEEILLAEIRSGGPMRFARFLEIALYHPTLGYYASGKARIGFHGDFFTNVSLGPAFGKILAIRFCQAWEEAGRPVPFFLVEQGADSGTLAADILRAASDAPEFFRALRMILVEPFAPLRARQEQSLSAWSDKVEWRDSIPFSRPVDGIFYSNELLDALPFVPVVWDGSRWLQKMVCASDTGGFAFELAEIDCPVTVSATGLLPIPPAGGYETEVRPAIGDWMHAVAASLRRGAVFAFDYGFPREIYYSPERRKGTLLCYSAHRRDESPLLDIGEKDITAHVDFTAVEEAALTNGFEILFSGDQHHFLVGAAEGWLRSIDGVLPDRETSRLLRNFRAIMHPEMMGRKFRAFVAVKSPGGFGCKNWRGGVK